MQTLPLEHEFRRFADDPGSVVDGALLVARVIDAETDCDWVRAELARRAETLGDDVSGASLIVALNSAGFAGAESYYTPSNSSLETVLKTRRGIPISLAVVALGLAEVRGLPAHGINFPRHFLVWVDGVYADPFRMAVIDPDSQARWLAEQKLSAEQAFPRASATDIVLRMLNNLRALAAERDDHAGALDLTGYQMLIAPDRFPYHLERADLWLKAGVPAMARYELDEALRVAPNDELKAELARRRLEIDGTADKLH